MKARETKKNVCTYNDWKKVAYVCFFLVREEKKKKYIWRMKSERERKRKKTEY